MHTCLLPSNTQMRLVVVRRAERMMSCDALARSRLAQTLLAGGKFEDVRHRQRMFKPKTKTLEWPSPTDIAFRGSGSSEAWRPVGSWVPSQWPASP